VQEQHHSFSEPLSFDIVEMTIDDVPDIIEIEKRSFVTPWSKNLFMKEYTCDLSKIFVAKTACSSAQRVVGYLCAWFIAGEVHILNLAAHPLFRRKKVATGLLSHCLAFSSARGIKWAFLEVRQSNEHALSLYSTYGFKPVGLRKGYYTDTHEDAIVMMLEMESPRSLRHSAR